MNKNLIILTSLLLTTSGVGGSFCFAQRPDRTSMMLRPLAKGATQLTFRTDADISQCIVPASPVLWGMDTAWDSEDNVRRGTNYIGKDIMGTGRVSFQPSDLVDANGNLSTAQQRTLQSRLNHIALSGTKNININCDHEVLMNKTNFPNCDQNYANYHAKPEEWVKVIKATMKYCQNKGFNVVSVSPFNEPDYTAWKEGSKSDFAAIAKLISEDPDFAGVRICGGNTLNCDEALPWYTALKPYVTEGNTHQLAGSFNSYANFWQTVRKDGNYATADELHNTMEAFVAAHYGMQSGIWWGWDGVCRGEYCRASYYGKEIGYAENRNAWTAAAVYKRPEGRIDAFLGGSERQANTSVYELVATDRPAYFDGVGPTYSYSMEIPGGTKYQEGQTNAECMVQVNYGEDVPMEAIDPAMPYVLMNRNSGLCMGFNVGSSLEGTQIVQNKYTGAAPNTYQQWYFEPVDSRIGGDFTYYRIRSVRKQTQMLDIKDWGTAAGVSIIGYSGGGGSNEQWYVEYAGNGDYYIRSRHSGLYLGIMNSSTKVSAAVQQQVFTGEDNQRWHLMPGKATLDTTAPLAPADLKAETTASSVRLSWTKSTSADAEAYMVLRGQQSADGTGITWDVIGRMITGTEFLDNCAAPGVTYSYKVKTVDKSRNQSEDNAIVTAQLKEDNALVAHYTFDDTTDDVTDNYLDALSAGTLTYNTISKKEGTKSLNLNGTDAFVMLPSKVGTMRQMTISLWAFVYSTTGAWSRLFDFGNGTDQYMFLTPNNGSEMRLVMKNGGAEQILSAGKLSTGWHHVTVTLASDKVSLYVDAEQVASSADITIRPADFRPVLNYIGKSQFAADPYLRAYIDDVRIYNYPLTSDEVKQVRDGEEPTAVKCIRNAAADATAAQEIYSLDGKRLSSPQRGINIINGKKKYN